MVSIFLSSACGAPIEKSTCYSSTKWSRQPPCSIDKQGGIAEMKTDCCVTLLLADPFSPQQRGAQLPLGNSAQPIFTAQIIETCITSCKCLETGTMARLHLHNSWAQPVQERYKAKISLQQPQQLLNWIFLFLFWAYLLFAELYTGSQSTGRFSVLVYLWITQ